jgi:hypothetical protein
MSFVNLLSFIFIKSIVKSINSIDDWALIMKISYLVIGFLFFFYWFREDVYVNDFREFDKKPHFMKWVFFCSSLIFGVVGIICFFESDFWVRSKMVRFFQ